MGNGGYSYYILLANKPNHIDLISIDKNQNKLYNNNGLNILKKFDLQDYHKLIEKDSIIGLSELLVENGKKSVDLIFINEMDNYENVLYDITLCDILLDINGTIIILITDKNKLKVSINYLKSTKKYDILRSDKNLIVFHKIIL
jgi:predicted O-methyltransferase YrrM